MFELSSLIEKWIEGEKDLKTEQTQEGYGVRCLVCDIVFYPEKKVHVIKHLKTGKHIVIGDPTDEDSGKPSSVGENSGEQSKANEDDDDDDDDVNSKKKRVKKKVKEHKKIPINEMKKWLVGEPNNLKIEDTEEGRGVLCLQCDVVFYPKTRGHVTSHLRHRSHVMHKCEATTENFGESSSVVENSGESSSTGAGSAGPSKMSEEDFISDLAKTFLYVNIPLSSVNNPQMQKFFEKYSNYKLPTESVLRKDSVSKLYNSTINEIRELVGDNYIWTSIDLTVDASGRCFANFILGILDKTETKPKLFSSKELSDITTGIIIEFVQDSLKLLWKDSYQKNKSQVLIIVTEDSTEMIKAGESLKQLYPNLLHITCLAGLLNKVSESLGFEYPKVTTLLSAINNVFLEKPYRINDFKEMFPNSGAPPKLEITRWGSWLNAVSYYADIYKNIKEFICSLQSEDSVCVADAIEAITEDGIKGTLNYIDKKFSTLGLVIRQLESNCLPLSESMDLLAKVKNDLNNLNSPIGIKMQDELYQAITKSPDFCVVEDINKFFKNKRKYSMINFEHAEYFKFCPVTIGIVDKSFSLYNDFLSDENYCKPGEDPSHLIIVYYNNNIDL